MKRTKVFTTSKLEEKDRAENLLSENQIAYEVKMKDVNQLHPFMTALMGAYLAGDHKPHYTWDFYVEKTDEEQALHLLKSIDRS